MHKQRQKYLTGKEMMAELHACKMKKCSFVDDNDCSYHLITSTLKPNPEWAKASGLPRNLMIPTKEALDEISEEQITNAMEQHGITRDEVVVRVMTFDHVPMFEKVRRASYRTGMNHPTMSFPPFKHYRLRNGQWCEVLRSHWSGGIDNGHFDNETHISNKLAKMFLLLCERISKKGNWVGYSYREEMVGTALVNLMERGLNFNEAESNNPFAFYSTAINNSFIRVINEEAGVRRFRDDCLQDAGVAPSMTRQVENELARFDPNGTEPLKRSRGRPRKASK